MNIELREYGAAREVPRLPDDVCAAIRPLVSITHEGSRLTRVAPRRPRSKVGVLRAGDVTVYVEPKLPIGQLLFLVDYAKKAVVWQDPAVDVDEAGGLAATVAAVYVRLAERALSRGALQGYTATSATLPVLKGRLRLGDQIGARYGASFPFEVSYSEFGADIAENRILKAAALGSLRLPRLRPETRAGLGRIVRQLSAAATLPLTESLAWRPNRLNAHFHDALRMAELILRGSAFDPVQGPVPAYGFVLDMDVVYEDFLGAALGEAMRAKVSGTWEAPYVTKLDVAGTVTIKPDFVYFVAGRPVALADAKYKFGTKQVPEDLYQMVVYCIALGLRRAHLVYAEGAGDATVHEVKQGGITVVRHALDLKQSQEDLLAAIDRLADDLVDDIALSRTTTRTAGGRA